jgi:hypothetical protein
VTPVGPFLIDQDTLVSKAIEPLDFDDANTSLVLQAAQGINTTVSQDGKKVRVLIEHNSAVAKRLLAKWASSNTMTAYRVFAPISAGTD